MESLSTTDLELDLGAVAHADDYESEREGGAARRRCQQLARQEQDDARPPAKAPRHQVPPPRATFEEAVGRHERGVQRQASLGMTAHERQMRYLEDYVYRYGRSERAANVGPQRNDYDVLAERHRFVWEEGDGPAADDWEGRLAKRYDDKLYKEYCLADLSRYTEGKLALRWRTEDEVIAGKGHFFCGSLKCRRREGLSSWEVPFAYHEHGKLRRVLVKLRLCPKCGRKLAACGGTSTPVDEAVQDDTDSGAPAAT